MHSYLPHAPLCHEGRKNKKTHIHTLKKARTPLTPTDTYSWSNFAPDSCLYKASFPPFIPPSLPSTSSINALAATSSLGVTFPALPSKHTESNKMTPNKSSAIGVVRGEEEEEERERYRSATSVQVDATKARPPAMLLVLVVVLLRLRERLIPKALLLLLLLLLLWLRLL